MTTELFEGLILTTDQIKSGSFTYRGKEVKLEQDKNNENVFTGKTKLSKKDKEAGNLEVGFTYNAGVATGAIATYICPPDTEEFKDLTDSEKITKLNSIAYQFGTEPTDRGQQLDHVLQNSVDTETPQDKQLKQTSPSARRKQDADNEDVPEPFNSNNNKDNVKSGDKVQVSKQ